MFNALKARFFDNERQQAIDEEMAEQAAAEKAAEREANFAKMSQAKQRALEMMRNNPNMPIEEMPDCPEKLAKIRTMAKDGTKFTDN